MKHQISIKTKDNVLSVEDFKAQGFTKDYAIGIILQTETIGIVISLDQWKEIWCDEDNYKVFNEACGEAKALQTLSGLELTRNIVKQNQEDGEKMTAAIRCWEYAKGDIQWYLPCLYELGTIIAYRDEVNKVLKMLDADLIGKDDWGWSSSEGYTHIAWYVGFGSGNFINGNKYGSKCYSNVVRAVSAFSPLERGDFSSPSGKVTTEPIMTEEAAVAFLRSLGYSGDLTKKIHV